MNKNPLAIACLALGILITVGVLTFAGPCVHEDGSVSTCHTAQIGVIVGGVVAIVASAIALFVKNQRAVGVLSLVVACAGLLVALAPGTLFELCMMSTMRCHMVMQPFAEVAGAALVAVAAISAVREFRSR